MSQEKKPILPTYRRSVWANRAIHQFEIVVETSSPDTLEEEIIAANINDVHIQPTDDTHQFTLTYYRSSTDFGAALAEAIEEINRETMAHIKTVRGPLRQAKKLYTQVEERG